MEPHEVDEVLARFGLDRAQPLIVQVSRFDRFKDPLGVIAAFRLVRRRDDARLVLAGGIVVQVIDHQTGFLVHSVEGLAFRLRYLLNRPQLAEEIGARGREFVRHHFLLTRHLRDWLVLLLAVTRRDA